MIRSWEKFGRLTRRYRAGGGTGGGGGRPPPGAAADLWPGGANLPHLVCERLAPRAQRANSGRRGTGAPGGSYRISCARPRRHPAPRDAPIAHRAPASSRAEPPGRSGVRAGPTIGPIGPIGPATAPQEMRSRFAALPSQTCAWHMDGCESCVTLHYMGGTEPLESVTEGQRRSDAVAGLLDGGGFGPPCGSLRLHREGPGRECSTCADMLRPFWWDSCCLPAMITLHPDPMCS